MISENYVVPLFSGTVDFNPGYTLEHVKSFKYTVPRSHPQHSQLDWDRSCRWVFQCSLGHVMMGSVSCKVESHTTLLPHCRSQMTRDDSDIPFLLVTRVGSLIGKILHFQSQKLFPPEVMPILRLISLDENSRYHPGNSNLNYYLYSHIQMDI